MAGLTTLLCETPAMRIGVAIRTLAEGQSYITGLAVGARGVALLALYLGMQSGERETCPGVIELPGGIFPVRGVVTLRTLGAQAAVVSVLVAGRAGRAQSQKGPAQIADLNRGPLPARNMLGSVAEIAADSGVFALQYIATLLVVEIPRIKLDQLKVGSVVFRVAARAFLARSRLHSISGV